MAGRVKVEPDGDAPSLLTTLPALEAQTMPMQIDTPAALPTEPLLANSETVPVAENIAQVSQGVSDDSNASSLTIGNATKTIEGEATQVQQPSPDGETLTQISATQALENLELTTVEPKVEAPPTRLPTLEERLVAKETAIIGALNGLNHIRQKIESCKIVEADAEIQA